MLTLPRSLATVLPRVVQPLGRIPVVRSTVSRLVVEVLANTTTPRPRPLTLFADYTTWTSLTDRTWSGRHLPPADPDHLADLPDAGHVRDLYRRGDEMVPSTDTSALFVFFAQWFTDSFLRTDRTDPRKNTSNHEIDLCQIYGLHADQTDKLRAHEGGRLKSQLIDGQEFPPFLFRKRRKGSRPVFKEEFAGLHDESFIVDTILDGASDAHIDSFFAVGLEHGNSTIGSTVLNTVFLREHNRVAGLLAGAHPGWDDDRVFETTRNVMIVVLLDLVVEEYIRHISPFDFPLQNVPFMADGKRWNKSNWCSVEFNLLYRWHSLVPDKIGDGADRLLPMDFRNNNPLVIAGGVESLITRCSRERAGRIGLGNTPSFLVDRYDPAQPSVEERTIAVARTARLAPYNDYREHFGLRRLSSFAELTSDERLAKELEAMYGDIDRLEWYVGIFAEEYPDYAMMGDLLTTMVAYDALTQALTNPLLARNVFTENTFSRAGMDVIEETHTLQQIVDRNANRPGAVHVSFSVPELTR